MTLHTLSLRKVVELVEAVVFFFRGKKGFREGAVSSEDDTEFAPP
jgi:hypothetical protein